MREGLHTENRRASGFQLSAEARRMPKLGSAGASCLPLSTAHPSASPHPSSWLRSAPSSALCSGVQSSSSMLMPEADAARDSVHSTSDHAPPFPTVTKHRALQVQAAPALETCRAHSGCALAPWGIRSGAGLCGLKSQICYYNHGALHALVSSSLNWEVRPHLPQT